MATARFIVVTGTDTGVGKTWVSVGLARALADRGLRVRALKPLETGCAGSPSVREDGVQLARATGQEAPRAALCRLREPLAPPMAADLEGGSLSYENLLRQVKALGDDMDIVLVEGAGGLLSPLTWAHTVIELARDLQAQIVLVSADKLGTISATRAACRVLRAEGLPIEALVLSRHAPAPEPGLTVVGEGGCGGPPDPSLGRNESALARFEEVPAPFVLDFLPSMSAAARALKPLAARLAGR